MSKLGSSPKIERSVRSVVYRLLTDCVDQFLRAVEETHSATLDEFANHRKLFPLSGFKLPATPFHPRRSDAMQRHVIHA